MKQVSVWTLALVLLGTLAAVPARTEDPKKPDNNLMKRKPEQSQNVLDGVTTQDFEKIEAGAEALIEITKQAGFQAHNGKDYDRFMNDFRRSAEGLIDAAKKKNIDAAALHHVDMTLTCVKCHKHLRETRMSSLD